jgi:hypothetical protein
MREVSKGLTAKRLTMAPLNPRSSQPMPAPKESRFVPGVRRANPNKEKMPSDQSTGCVQSVPSKAQRPWHCHHQTSIFHVSGRQQRVGEAWARQLKFSPSTQTAVLVGVLPSLPRTRFVWPVAFGMLLSPQFQKKWRHRRKHHFCTVDLGMAARREREHWAHNRLAGYPMGNYDGTFVATGGVTDSATVAIPLRTASRKPPKYPSSCPFSV